MVRRPQNWGRSAAPTRGGLGTLMASLPLWRRTHGTCYFEDSVATVLCWRCYVLSTALVLRQLTALHRYPHLFWNMFSFATYCLLRNPHPTVQYIKVYISGAQYITFRFVTNRLVWCVTFWINTCYLCLLCAVSRVTVKDDWVFSVLSAGFRSYIPSSWRRDGGLSHTSVSANLEILKSANRKEYHPIGTCLVIFNMASVYWSCFAACSENVGENRLHILLIKDLQIVSPKSCHRLTERFSFVRESIFANHFGSSTIDDSSWITKAPRERPCAHVSTRWSILIPRNYDPAQW
jgi:hypothetical protein